MSKKTLLLALGLMVILATAGCFDLFAVPGVAVSPDGSQVYFLATAGQLSEQLGFSSLDSVSINGGDPTVIAAGDKENLSSAFAVNPTNGDVAYVQTSKANGTQVMVYSGGSSHELVGNSAFGAVGVGTMMRYSPDGSHIALTMSVFPPDVTIDSLEASSSDLTADQFKNMHFVLFLINTADGTVTPVSDQTKEAANTMAWSPDSKLLAYNAWIDGNDDGTIATMPDFTSLAAGGAGGAAAPGDTSQIRILDVGSGKVTPVDSKAIDYAETFISNTEVAYVSLDIGGLMGGAAGGAGGPAVMAYDVASGASRVAYTPKGGGLVMGMELSPDGSQIAWIELSSSGASGLAGGGGDNQPSELYVGANFDASAGPIAEIPGKTGFPDAPVWTPDGKSILVSSTNIFAAIVGQMGSAFGGAGGLTGATGAGATPTEEIPKQQLLKVDVASKTVTTIYEGPMTNSSFFASIIGLANSGAMSQLGGLGGGAVPTPGS